MGHTILSKNLNRWELSWLGENFSFLSDFIFISLSLKLYLYLRAPQTLSRSRLFCEHSGVINWVIIRRLWITYGFHVLALLTEQLKDSWEEIFDWIVRLSFKFSSTSFLSDWRSREWNWKANVLCSLLPQYFSSARLLYVFPIVSFLFSWIHSQFYKSIHLHILYFSDIVLAISMELQFCRRGMLNWKSNSTFNE